MLSASTSSIPPGLDRTAANADGSLQSERRARRTWVGLIVTLLGLQVIAGIVTVYLATSDPTAAVIPNYYQSGLNWDVKRRNLDQFVKLGWHVVVEVQTADAETHQRPIAIHLNKDQFAVGKQRVSAAIFHHARGSEIYKVHFDEAHEGQYLALCRLTQAGLWQFEISIEGDHGVAETRFTLDVKEGEATEYRFPESPEQVL